MKNQFFYTRRETLKEGEEPVSFTDSFNLNKVIRSIGMQGGGALLLLDDIHQRPQDREIKNKQGKTTSIKREMVTFQSEIYLEAGDAQRFYKLTNIETI